MIRTGIHLKALVVLQVIDDFTGRPVERGTVRLVLPRGVQAVAKEEGIFVITGSDVREITCSLTSPVYEEQYLELNLDSLKSDAGVSPCPYINLRMIPSAAMPVPPGTTILEGRAEPGSQIFAVCDHPAAAMKLLTDYEAGKAFVEIYHASEESLSGCRIAFGAKGKPEETGRIDRETEDGQCQLAEPLTHSYKRVGTSIYPVQEGRTDAAGYYRILLRTVPMAGCSCTVIVRKPDGSEERILRDIVCGERNSI